MCSKTIVWNDHYVLFCRKLNGIFLNILQDWRSYRFFDNIDFRFGGKSPEAYFTVIHSTISLFIKYLILHAHHVGRIGISPKKCWKKMFICMEVCTYGADWCMLSKYGLWRKIVGKSLKHVCHSCESSKCFEVTTMNKITSNSIKHAILNDVLNQISVLFPSKEISNKKDSLSIVTFSVLWDICDSLPNWVGFMSMLLVSLVF